MKVTKPSMAKILLVDDDPSFNAMLSSFLRRQRHEVEEVFSSKSALLSLQSNRFDLVLTDFRLPDMDGLELIRHIKHEKPELPVILITNYSDIRTAVTSIKLGAYEFVTKPVIPDELLIIIEQALKGKQTAPRIIKKPNQDADISRKSGYIIGTSKNSQATWEHLTLVAPTNMTVLIIGDSGTGKEYAARMIHEKSKRSSQPFVALDCGVLSKELAASELFGHAKGAFTGAIKDKVGCFEQANNGTIFLDEIGNLPYEVQAQLLRAIQERNIRRIGSDKDILLNVRIIAATNENLKNVTGKSLFRTDLYHRLNEFELNIPPLKERMDDLQEYITLFLKLASTELEKEVEGITDEVLLAMKTYSWPGNLRELKNVVKRGVLLSTGNKLTMNQLPLELRGDFHTPVHPAISGNEALLENTTDLKIIQEQQEKKVIIKLLEKTKYNKSKTAKLLNIDRKTLYNKLTKYGIEI